MREGLPTGTVTFLFTDVEGSTTLLHELGDAGYAAALAEHRRLIREACIHEGGVEVDTQGDAFFFAFPTAPGAVAAAEAMTETLASGPIQVRVGLHTGTPLLADEGYVGGDVHRAARMAAAGHGGQVLVSSSTERLVDTELRDLGEHRFKDLSTPEHVFQIGDHEFAPLKTLYQTNLPIPQTPFMGRERELGEVLALLERNDVRLLTLTGPGGTGKTRLAAQAAGALADRYPDGVFWVPLAPLRDPDLVLESAGRALGASNGLASHIADKRMLLLFDNFEHVVDAAPGLSALLSECPQLELLVTSREQLHLAGEHEYPVPPLAAKEAVGFFLVRARATKPDFEVDDAVLEICRRLDELPLALELAAARVKALSTDQIRTRLEQRLPLLTGGSRDAPERQRTLRSTIEWSYDLLSSTEQQLFHRLAVFAGGCTLEAAEEVCYADLDTLQSLVEKSLLRFSNERFWMLETIREYAADRIEDAGEAEELSDRHADYFLDFAQRHGPLVESAFQSDARHQLTSDDSNLRLAMTHVYDRSPERVLEFVSALAVYWSGAGRSTETQIWAERALANAPPEPTVLRADALLVLSLTASRVGDIAKAVASAREAIGIYQTQQSQRLGRALVYLANAYVRAGSYEDARSAFQDAIEYSDRATDEWTRTLALSNLGYLSLILGDYKSAEQLSLEAVDLKRELGNEIGAMESLCNAGLAALLALRLDEARRLLDDTLGISVDLGHDTIIACSLEGFAWMAARSSELERAARLQGAAETRMAAAGGQLDGVEQKIHDETQTAIRDGLGQSCDEQLAIGRSLGVDEAVALALESSPPAPPPS